MSRPSDARRAAARAVLAVDLGVLALAVLSGEDHATLLVVLERTPAPDRAIAAGRRILAVLDVAERGGTIEIRNGR